MIRSLSGLQLSKIQDCALPWPARSLGMVPGCHRCRDGILHGCCLLSLGHELTSSGHSSTKRALTSPLALQAAMQGESELEKGVHSQRFLWWYQTWTEIKDTASMLWFSWLVLSVSSLCVRQVSLKLKAILPSESSLWEEQIRLITFQRLPLLLGLSCWWFGSAAAARSFSFFPRRALLVEQNKQPPFIEHMHKWDLSSHLRPLKNPGCQ